MMIGDEGEMDSLYSPDSGKPKGAPDSIDQEIQEGETSTVPLSVLTGKHGPPKEGDEVVLKVVKISGDQAVVAYAPEKPGAEGEEMPADQELDKMSDENEGMGY